MTRWGSLQRSPDHLAGFKVPTSKGREGREAEGREGNGGEGISMIEKSSTSTLTQTGYITKTVRWSRSGDKLVAIVMHLP